MADDSEGGSFLTRKAFGGVPNWVWMLGAVVLGYFVMQRKGGSKPAQDTSNDGQTADRSPYIFFLPQGPYVTPSPGTGNSGANSGNPPGTGGPSPKQRYKTITVAKWNDRHAPWNSTLWGIADHYKVRGGYQRLAELNKISDPDLIYPGQKIKVPIS